MDAFAVPPQEQWLLPFLHAEYYKDCPSHEHNNSNRCNFYCIHCTLPICESCVRSQQHQGHHILQIRRASNACSVDTASISGLIDTSGLHKFKINGFSIHFLVSRSNSGDTSKFKAKARSKGHTRDDYSRCRSCQWALPGGVAQRSSFCSISCKVHVQAVSSGRTCNGAAAENDGSGSPGDVGGRDDDGHGSKRTGADSRSTGDPGGHGGGDDDDDGDDNKRARSEVCLDRCSGSKVGGVRRRKGEPCRAHLF